MANRSSKYQELLNEFVDAHNAVVRGGQGQASPEAQARRLFAALKLLEASEGAGGPEGALDMDALLREAGERFDADISREAVAVAVPADLTDADGFAARSEAAVAEAEADYKSKVDQTLSVAASVVKTVAKLAVVSL